MDFEIHRPFYLDLIGKYLSGREFLPKHKIYEILWALKKGYILWDNLPPNADEILDIPYLTDYGVDLVNSDITKSAQVKLYEKSTITWTDFSKFFTFSNSLLDVNVKNMYLLTNKSAKISKHVMCAITRNNIKLERYDFDDLIPKKIPEFKDEEKVINEIEQRDYLVECSSLFRNGEKDFYKFELPCGIGKSFIIYDIIKKSNGKNIIFVPWIDLATQMEKEARDVGIKTAFIGDGRNTIKNEHDLLICIYASVDKVPKVEYQYMFIDEAHHIENTDSQFRNKIFDIKCEKTLCLSATYHFRDNLDFEMNLRDGIDKGYLTDYVLNIEYYTTPNKENALMKTIKENMQWSPMFIYFNRTEKGAKFAKELRKMNLSAYHLESSDGKKKRDDIKNGVLNRTIDIVCLCGIYNEGISINNLKTVIFGDLRFSEVNKIQVSMRASRKHITKPFYRVVLPLVEKDFEENDIKELIRCWNRIDPKIKESIEKKSTTRIRIKKNGSYEDAEFIKEEIFDRFGNMLKGMTTDEKIQAFLKIVDEKGIPPQNGTVLFSDNTCTGLFWGNAKSKRKLENEPYSVLLENDILKKDYDKFLENRNKEKSSLTIEDKIEEIIKFIEEKKYIPSQTKDFFSDKSSMGGFLSKCKANNKFKTKPYDKLLENQIIKKNYEEFLKIQEKNKSNVKLTDEEKVNVLYNIVKDNTEIPTQQGDKYLFEDMGKVGAFWSKLKQDSEKINMLPYSKLLELELLKTDYENFLKISSKNKEKQQTSIDEKITFFIEEVENLQKIPTINKTSLFPDGICMGSWFSKLKLGGKYENEPYNELLQNEIIKKDIDDYLSKKSNTKLKFQDKIKELKDFCDKYNKLPSWKDDLFSDGGNMARFWSDTKTNKRVLKKPYDVLLENSVLKINWEEFSG